MIVWNCQVIPFTSESCPLNCLRLNFTSPGVLYCQNAQSEMFAAYAVLVNLMWLKQYVHHPITSKLLSRFTYFSFPNKASNILTTWKKKKSKKKTSSTQRMQQFTWRSSKENAWHTVVFNCLFVLFCCFSTTNRMNTQCVKVTETGTHSGLEIRLCIIPIIILT